MGCVTSCSAADTGWSSRWAAGASSLLWRAHDQLVDRRVAVKVLSDVLERDRSRAADFRRQARLAVRLHHRHVVDGYDWGEVPCLYLGVHGTARPKPVKGLLRLAGRASWCSAFLVSQGALQARGSPAAPASCLNQRRSKPPCGFTIHIPVGRSGSRQLTVHRRSSGMHRQRAPRRYGPMRAAIRSLETAGRSPSQGQVPDGWSERIPIHWRGFLWRTTFGALPSATAFNPVWG